QSSTLFHVSTSVTALGPSYGPALRFSLQAGVPAPTSFRVIIRPGTFVPPLSSGAPRAVSAATSSLTRGSLSDPAGGTLPLGVPELTTNLITVVSDGAGVDTGLGGLLFFMNSVWPA